MSDEISPQEPGRPQVVIVGPDGMAVGGGTGDAAQITSWVEKHFTSQTIAGITVYNLTSPVSS